jgi:2-keto-4-pentenoate hydratase/2-oxohepta-3-ene-1,7-dioic acid hydratase in catechol pathway
MEPNFRIDPLAAQLGPDPVIGGFVPLTRPDIGEPYRGAQVKFVRYGPPGQERPGLLDSEGCIRDLSAQMDDLTPEGLDSARMRYLSVLDPRAHPKVAKGARLGPPIAGLWQLIRVGFDARSRDAQSDPALPPQPTIVLTSGCCRQGPDDDVLPPGVKTGLDWDVALGVVIGRRASYIAERQAMAYVFGYVLIADMPEGWFRHMRDGAADEGSARESFGPVGPWLVTKEEIENVQDLDVWLRVNSTRRRKSNTRELNFSVEYIVHYLSQLMVLEPGDIVSIGTRASTTSPEQSPVVLKKGDVIKLGIDRLGSQRHPVHPVARTRRSMSKKKPQANSSRDHSERQSMSGRSPSKRIGSHT